jgi:G3E family GTPase
MSNFVYKSSKPFDSKKLFKVLMKWPVPVMEELNLGEMKELLEVSDDLDAKSPFVGVLRSKGFAWVAPSVLEGPFNDLERHDTVMYWSHAGKHFGLKEAGSWWASMGKEAMKQVFENNLDEYERIIREDFVSGEWGDRRQEIVFIGANIDEKEITEALDRCLCTDEQVAEYKTALIKAIEEYYASQ